MAGKKLTNAADQAQVQANSTQTDGRVPNHPMTDASEAFVWVYEIAQPINALRCALEVSGILGGSDPPLAP